MPDDDGAQVGDVGQHDRIGDEAGVFELLFLLDGIAALDHRPAKRHPIEEVVIRIDLGGLGTGDALPNNLANSITADALQMICEPALPELTNVEPPRGFGRD